MPIKTGLRFEIGINGKDGRIMQKSRIVFKQLFVILLLLGLCAGLTNCKGRGTYQTADPNAYMETEGHIANEGMDIRSGLFIFPESIEGLENVQYQYACKEGLLENSYLIYLKATYSDTAYREEKERLANIRCTVELPENTVENAIEYSETLFDYPAYVAVYNTNMSFEYALADDEHNCIRYVYLKLYEGADYIAEEYLPLEFKGKSMLNYDTTWQNQNIYYATDSNGDHVYYLD